MRIDVEGDARGLQMWPQATIGAFGFLTLFLIGSTTRGQHDRAPRKKAERRLIELTTMRGEHKSEPPGRQGS